MNIQILERDCMSCENTFKTTNSENREICPNCSYSVEIINNIKKN